MLGDSFCKNPGRGRRRRSNNNFQSPCLGTLFASEVKKGMWIYDYQLSIPMLGDSFCKPNTWYIAYHPPPDAFNPHAWGLFLQVRSVSELAGRIEETFNPHAWGLFLQAAATARAGTIHFTLSIPMLGDSFCKQLTTSHSYF